MSGALILSLTHGIDVHPHDDPFIAVAEQGLEVIEASLNAGAYLGV